MQVLEDQYLQDVLTEQQNLAKKIAALKQLYNEQLEQRQFKANAASSVLDQQYIDTLEQDQIDLALKIKEREANITKVEALRS